MRKVLYLTCILLAFASCKEEKKGCTDPEAVNYDCAAETDDQSCQYYELGTYEFGGIIFYLDETGKHGLVAATSDLIEGSQMGVEGTPDGYEWGCAEIEVPGVIGEEIGTGMVNTQEIVDAACETVNGGVTAAEAALEHEIEVLELNDVGEVETVVYDDWYLPSIDELEEMLNVIGPGSEIGPIGGFDEHNMPYYWSSTEANSSYAWLIFYSGGYMLTTSNKNISCRVRPIRSF